MIKFISGVLLSIALVVPVFAQEGSADADVRIGDDVGISASLRVRLEAAKEDRMMHREEMEEEREMHRDEMLQERETHKSELMARLRIISSERKRNIIEHIFDQLNSINARLSAHFNSVLSKLSSIVGRIEAGLDTDGEGAAEAVAALEAANAAIVDAQIAVDAQAAKSYTVEITGETSLREDVGAVRDQLHQDLRETKATVDDARRAVRVAITAYANLRGSLSAGSDGSEDDE